MIEGTANGNFQTVVTDDEPQIGELDNERPQESSPTRRTAAYHPDIKLVGRSQAFSEVMQQVGRASTTDLPVLVFGEPGTGKALIAATIHHQSDRTNKPFVAVNCRTNTPEVLAAELSGDGTLFLNELTSSVEEMLVQALATQKLSVRLIVAGNRDLEGEVTLGAFHRALLHRFNAVSIVLPALRERVEDVAPLAQTFADRVYSLSPAVNFSPEALALLERYSWPGNIRELENAIVRAVVMCDGTIRVKDLPARVRNYTQKQLQLTNGDHGAAIGAAKEEWVPLSEIEGRYVAQVLEHTRGNKQAAARVLAVDRKTLDRMIKRHHIDSEKVRRAAR